ncbi:MAG: hypothetical protein ACQER9_02080 [Nanobdellota archaeon]
MICSGNKKGIVFTIDSIFALIIITGFIGFMFLNFFNMYDQKHNHIPSFISEDILESLEYSNSFNDAIKDDNSSILGDFINNSLPERFCSVLSVYNSTDKKFVVMSGKCDTERVKSVSYRSFISGGKEYYTKMEVWVN